MQWCASILVTALLVAGSVFADTVYKPYQPDEFTLHLWHLDEAAPPFRDAGSSPTPLLGLKNGAKASHASLPGMGSAIRFDPSAGDDIPAERPYGPILMAAPEPAFGPEDNVPGPFPIMGDDGAFTIEAIVKLDTLPSESPGFAADIVTMDDDVPASRVFLFRIEKPNFLCFVPLSGDAVRGGGLATIPTSGPHAINTKDWFHVAVTYDGNENVPHNLKLYWTRLTPETRHANPIGRGSLSADLSRELGDFAIGNSGKVIHLGPFEFFPGLIDEVRISNIAREPYDFFFVSPEVRKEMAGQAGDQQTAAREELVLQKVWMNGVEIPHGKSPLSMPPGNHRMDFDFGFPSGAAADPLAVKSQLEGLDDEWQPIERGMSLTWEMLDANGKTLASTVHWVTHSSSSWKSDMIDSPLENRSEPLFIPEETRSVRVTMSSGTPDTTGCWIIDNLSLSRSSQPERNLWQNGGFDQGERTDQIGGVPLGWKRSGSEPAIARVMLAFTGNPS
ncbi:MAG: LamG domain-containing protein, partial [Verrucomicrobiaceae bacterium]